MTVTLTSLVGMVKRQLKDPEFDDDEIVDYLNLAQEEVLGESPYMFLEKIDEQSIATEGYDELDLPIDFQTLRKLTIARDTVGYALDYIEPRTFLAEKATRNHMARPSYTVYGDKVLTYLPKSSSTEGTTVEPWNATLYYIAKPTEMVEDDDKPTIPSEFREILVLGALFRVEEERDNYDFSAIKHARYNELVENLKLRYGVRQQDGGNRARVPYGNRVTIY